MSGLGRNVGCKNPFLAPEAIYELLNAGSHEPMDILNPPFV